MAVKMDHGEDDLVENHEIDVTPFIYEMDEVAIRRRLNACLVGEARPEK